MPQKSISGKRLPVVATSSYLFDADSFVTYRLEDEYSDINLIIADGEQEAGAYLALSRRIEERLFPSLFVSPLPQEWFACAEGHVLDVAAYVLGAPKGWLAPRYTLAMKTRGRILEGDFRLRKHADRVSLSRAFDYALLVDETNAHALEAELYEDGTLHVFATVYRPGTDIGEISRPFRFDTPSLPVATTQTAVPLPWLVQNTKAEPQDAPTKEAAALPAGVEEASPVHEKFGRIALTHPVEPALTVADTLACDTALAGKLIDEAQRNGMLLSELIRKVIDLPARIQEQVLIPFAIEPAEYAELARRYNLPVSDTQAVRSQILEDLQHFAGRK